MAPPSASRGHTGRRALCVVGAPQHLQKDQHCQEEETGRETAPAISLVGFQGNRAWSSAPETGGLF